MMQFTLQGDKEIERRLLELERKVGKKIVKKAVVESTKPIMKAAKANALSMVGGNMGKLISQSLVSRNPKKQRRGQYLRSVRLRSSREDSKLKKSKGVAGFVHTTKAGKEYYIPAAIEYGHDNVAAKPFMRAAYLTKARITQKFLADWLWRGIAAEIRRIGG
jgi:hypothetical protein